MHYYFCYESNFIKLGIGLYLSPVESKDFGCRTIFPPPSPQKKKNSVVFQWSPSLAVNFLYFPLILCYRKKGLNLKILRCIVSCSTWNVTIFPPWKLLVSSFEKCYSSWHFVPLPLPSTCNVELWAIFRVFLEQSLHFLIIQYWKG